MGPHKELWDPDEHIFGKFSSLAQFAGNLVKVVSFSMLIGAYCNNGIIKAESGSFH